MSDLAKRIAADDPAWSRHRVSWEALLEDCSCAADWLSRRSLGRPLGIVDLRGAASSPDTGEAIVLGMPKGSLGSAWAWVPATGEALSMDVVATRLGIPHGQGRPSASFPDAFDMLALSCAHLVGRAGGYEPDMMCGRLDTGAWYVAEAGDSAPTGHNSLIVPFGRIQARVLGLPEDGLAGDLADRLGGAASIVVAH